jgi:glycosyltransferase involved in cell wall biosynthesis
MAAVTAWIAKHGRGADAIYATGLHTEAVIGARLAGVPSIVKIVGDSVWERGRRLGLTQADFDAFQSAGRPTDVRLRALAWLRDRTLRASTAVTTPSRYLAEVVESWLGGPSDVRVIANGVRVPPELSALPAGEGLRVIYVGRLVQHKRVDRLIAAMTDGMTLDIIGTGPHEDELRALPKPARSTVALHGDLPHPEVLARIGAADVLALASDYEGLPHVVIEALAAGTPVVSPPVGGVPEIITDGSNGLILRDTEPETIRRAFVRMRDDHELRGSLAEGARASGSSWRIDRTVAGILTLVDDVGRERPRVAFLGKTHVPKRLRVGDDMRERYEILVRHTRPVVVGVGAVGTRWLGRTRVAALPELRPPALGGALFYAVGPLVGAAFALIRKIDVIVCQSPYEGIGAIGVTRLVPRARRPAIVVEVHGDWRTATRLYGSSARRLVSPVADVLAMWAIQRADSIRVIGEFTEGLVRSAGYTGPVDTYTAFGGLRAFLESPPAPLPDAPAALFVGALEPSKSVDVLLEAWRTVVSTVPGARLTIIGEGSHGSALRRQAELAGFASAVRFLGSCSRSQVIKELDRTRVLALPSRSEGMGRVILEAFARGRPVVGTEVGGIPDLIRDPGLGRLVPAEDSEALAKALVEFLTMDETTRSGYMVRTRSEVDWRDASRTFEAGIERLSGWGR